MAMPYIKIPMVTDDDDQECQGENTGIERLPDDCLCFIFEFGGKMDWRSPYKLQRVCRRWHAILDHAPRAWSSVRISERPDTTAIDSKTFAKSGEVPLHIGGTFPLSFHHLSTVHARVCCLYAEAGFSDLAPDARFPLLYRLRTMLDKAQQPDIFNKDHFPVLQHLQLDIHYAADLHINLPRLISCRLWMRGDVRWQTVLRSCQSTLAYLKITVEDRIFPIQSMEISLPCLKHLSLTYTYRSLREASTSRTRFQTPLLESYEQVINLPKWRGRPVLSHNDVASVTRAKTNRPLLLDNTFHSLEEITIYEAQDASLILEQLRSNMSLAPRLSKIFNIAGPDDDPDGQYHEATSNYLDIINQDRPQKIILEKLDAKDDPFRIIDSFGRCDYSACQS